MGPSFPPRPPSLRFFRIRHWVALCSARSLFPPTHASHASRITYSHNTYAIRHTNPTTKSLHVHYVAYVPRMNSLPLHSYRGDVWV
ncbi:hypothetical protein DFH08DRAFT_886795 [Mycena albidolilacea]|uniref:Uncharacterized protein n=1 Tax=Mycena albidolilacea TaxID=1033008 RepID=A0AAD7EH67_9AGAR|nr:hypothetical protein DFH08DRAFT_886795 [Mycena albidolilacea]